MQDEYWKGRWKRGETGWHQLEVEPGLKENFNGLSPCRVFVPLCGKSLDLKWLHDGGHEVIGVEFSDQACREFFKESSIQFNEFAQGPFTVFKGDRITLFNGDFFQLTPSDVGRIDAVYDRAALIALPAALRLRYARHMMRLLGGSPKGPFRFLQIVLQRTPHDEEGPPYSVHFDEIQKLYGDVFKFRPLSREKVELGTTPQGSIAEECVYACGF